jgi:threonine dehydrogenase-like Zn-dependent dehydrogenase
MKAAVPKAVNVVEVEEVPELVTQPDQIKVKIAYAGSCGTDIEILRGQLGLVKEPGFPKIEGHEVSGTIAEVERATKLGYRVGQRVAMIPAAPCGACYFCRNGQEGFCKHNTDGFESIHGCSSRPASSGGLTPCGPHLTLSRLDLTCIRSSRSNRPSTAAFTAGS